MGLSENRGFVNDPRAYLSAGVHSGLSKEHVVNKAFFDLVGFDGEMGLVSACFIKGFGDAGFD
jgi:hypothetical protein